MLKLFLILCGVAVLQNTKVPVATPAPPPVPKKPAEPDFSTMTDQEVLNYKCRAYMKGDHW